MFLINKPKDKTITETKVLNRLSKSFRNCSFYKNNCDEITEYFEINYIDWTWEYLIKYNGALIVFKESDENNLDSYIYLNENDLFPVQTQYLIIERDEHKMNFNFCKSIENIINKLKSKK